MEAGQPRVLNNRQVLCNSCYLFVQLSYREFIVPFTLISLILNTTFGPHPVKLHQMMVAIGCGNRSEWCITIVIDNNIGRLWSSLFMPGIVLLGVFNESDWLLQCLILGKTCVCPVFAVIFTVYGISGMEGLFYQRVLSRGLDL